MSSANENKCVLCQQNDSRKVSKLGTKGVQSIKTHGKQKGEELEIHEGQYVHVDCRRLYCHPRQDKTLCKTPDSKASERQRRSGDIMFKFERDCFFCGTLAKLNGKKRGYDVFPVRTLEFQSTIHELCVKRNDEWGNSVLGRLEYAQDLPAVEARYHQTCSTNFRTGLNIPHRYIQSDQDKRKGRPVKPTVEAAFSKVMEYLEDNTNQQVSVSDLVKKMEDLCGHEAYSIPYMKKKTLEYLGCEVIISEVNGKADVITFRSTSASILHAFYRKKETSKDSDQDVLIKAAAKVISDDIKACEFEKTLYPTADDIMDLEQNKKYVPKSLLLMLQQIMTSKNCEKKQLSIGQSIVQACLPRATIAPLQIGLGVQLHHHFGSKFLIETLNSLGFCSSYTEVQRYEMSAAACWKPGMEKQNEEQIVQFVADNVDHNTGTIDGLNTFHGMGIIATVTPSSTIKRQVPRVLATLEDVVALGSIDIKYFNQNSAKVSALKFAKLASENTVEDPTGSLSFLLKVSRPLSSRTPSWSGFMQMVQSGIYPGKSSILFLPMIDLSPNDMTCIYSTLAFICKQAQTMRVSPIVTFDQPLFWKAQQIVYSENSDLLVKAIVLRLGAFHTEMSFVGCIGQLMENTGLTELLESVYAPNSVSQMICGKAISRAVRSHFLVDDALNTLFMEYTVPAFSSEINECEEREDQDQSEVADKTMSGELKSLVEDVMAKKVAPESLPNNEHIGRVIAKWTSAKKSLEPFRTAKLWMQYMDMVDILRAFIKAERTGNWELHLAMVKEMLPYFAATGHHLYLKSAYIYYQQMMNLQETHPDVYRLISSGGHVVRRSDRFWAGLSTDLVIEQVLMRSVKATGGMTRGRGMSDSQRAHWLLSMPACSEINNSMQEFTGQSYESSHQHKEAYNARINRDNKDRNTFYAFLKERNPLSKEKALRNIATGEVAEEAITVDCARQLGQKLVKEMEDQDALTFSFKKCNKATTMGSKHTLKIGDDRVHIDPQLLFQRLLTVTDNTLDNPVEVFQHELCSHPASLFDNSGLLRQSPKSQLANTIWEMGDCGVEDVPTDVTFVLDGGSLIHRLPWLRGMTYGAICESYCNMIHGMYGCPHVVFDGYKNGNTTKDVAHARRSKGFKGPAMLFDRNSPFKTKKDVFLSNEANKQHFIDLLAVYLQERGCIVHHAPDDADMLIASTALTLAKQATVAVIGEDTDLLVLLCHHAAESTSQLPIYFLSDVRHGLKKKKLWHIGKAQKVLGKDTCLLLPFIHAFSGCDTTSHIHGLSKAFILRKVMSDENLKRHACVFLRDSTQSEVQGAGEEALLCLYQANDIPGLDILRYCRFLQKVQTKSTALQVQSLPPTSNAAKFHSFRTYLQISTWLGKNLKPEDWGWSSSDGKLSPIKTTVPAAPDRLLKCVRCSCTQNCDSKRCTCRKHGLSCTPACGECRGMNCSNCDLVVLEDQDQV